MRIAVVAVAALGVGIGGCGPSLDNGLDADASAPPSGEPGFAPPSEAPVDPASDPADPVAATTPPALGWTIAVWMDGDNNLEPLLADDLDELERGAGPGVAIVAQVDRIPGYAPTGGDGAIRIEIAPDQSDALASPVVADLGEVDMGSGEALSEFLDWADAAYPAEHLAVVFWNHGGGFWIASDDTSGSVIRIDNGELARGLASTVARRGPVDLVAFDACNMGEWEVADALVGSARAMAASQAWVGDGGYAYDVAFTGLDASTDGVGLGDRMAQSAGITNDELTHAVVDLDAVPALTAAVDGLAGAYLADPVGGVDAFVDARDAAFGLDRKWDEFWLDLGSLADLASVSDAPDIAAAGLEVRARLDDAVVAHYGRDVVSFASGLTVFTDTRSPDWLDRYARGPWASTRWDEVLRATADAGR